jgi:protein-tyrosine phosphatase
MIIENPNLLLKFLNLGVLCQANVGSIRGFFGERVQETVFKLIEHRMIHFIASDAHSLRMRTPILTDAYQIVCELYNKAYADLLFENNPRKILNHEKI